MLTFMDTSEIIKIVETLPYMPVEDDMRHIRKLLNVDIWEASFLPYGHCGVKAFWKWRLSEEDVAYIIKVAAAGAIEF